MLPSDPCRVTTPSDAALVTPTSAGFAAYMQCFHCGCLTKVHLREGTLYEQQDADKIKVSMLTANATHADALLKTPASFELRAFV